jgi:hypothetical protein
MVLREKIVETHDLEVVIETEIATYKAEISKNILRETLQSIRDVRDDCYNIAQKLKIK